MRMWLAILGLALASSGCSTPIVQKASNAIKHHGASKHDVRNRELSETDDAEPQSVDATDTDRRGIDLSDYPPKRGMKRFVIELPYIETPRIVTPRMETPRPGFPAGGSALLQRQGPKAAPRYPAPIPNPAPPTFTEKHTHLVELIAGKTLHISPQRERSIDL